MRKLVRRIKRQRWANEVVSIGERLKPLRAQQAKYHVAEVLDPQLDARIRSLTRRRERLLTYLKETADV